VLELLHSSLLERPWQYWGGDINYTWVEAKEMAGLPWDFV